MQWFPRRLCCRLLPGLILWSTLPAWAAPEGEPAKPAEPQAPAAGQPAAPAEPLAPPPVPAQLSLRDSIRLAMTHNANLRQSYTNVENARSRLLTTAQVNQTMLESGMTHATGRNADGTLNTVGSTYSQDFVNGTSLSVTGALPWIDTRNAGGQAGLELALPLMKGRGRSSDKQIAINQSAIAFDQQQLQYFISRQDLVERVNRAYFNALRAQQGIVVQRQAVDIAQKATDDAQKRLDAGLITEIDVTRAKIQLSSAREALVNQEAAFRDALDSLVLLLGLPVGATPQLTDTVPDVATVGSPIPMTPAPASAVRTASNETAPSPGAGGPEPPAESAATPDVAAAIREALANRPELKLRQLELADAEVQKAAARNRKKPRADLTANLSTLGLSLLTGGGVGGLLTSVFGLRLSAPVNKVALREDEATANRNITQLQRMEELDRQEIVDEVRSLVRAQETSKSNIDLLTENLKVAEQSFRLAQRLIEEGLADNRNLLDAQSALTNTQSSLISAKIDYAVTSVSLRRALGEDLLQHYDLPAVPMPEVDRAIQARIHRPDTQTAGRGGKKNSDRQARDDRQ
jgi:outer membrane protein TolC